MISRIRSLRAHQGFMRYFANTSWLFAEKILRMVVGLFVGIWVARYLGPEQFGLFSYAQSFVGLFAAIATLGLDGIVVRELVKHPEKESEIVGTAFLLKVIGAFSVILILAIAVNFTSNDSYTNILVFIIASATIFQSFNVIDLYFQSKVLSKYAVYANMLSLFISSIIKIILILNKAPLIAFAGVVVFDSFVLACGFIYFYIKNNSTFNIQHSTFKRETAVSLLKDSWPLILSGIVISIYMKIDQVMIMEMMDAEAVGQYAAAVRIAEIFLIPIGILSTSLAPAIFSRIGQNSEITIYKYLSQYYTLIGYIIVAFIFFMSNFFILNTYGMEYSLSANILDILILSTFLVYTTSPFSNYFIGHNKTKVILLVTTISVILNIILNYFLIKNYGVMGAAYATLIARSATNIALLFINKELFKIQIKSLLILNLNIRNK